jgi:protease IV
VLLNTLKQEIVSRESVIMCCIQLSSGKFKDMLDPNRTLSQEEKNLIKRDLEIVHENFIQAVSENRNITIEKVRLFADGSSVLGEQAKALGLIDEIGGYSEAIKYIESLIGEEASVCW